MAPSKLLSPGALATTLCATLATAQRALYSDSNFSTCVPNSQLQATYFGASLTPDNHTLAYDLVGVNKFSGNATVAFSVVVSSQPAFQYTLDPCLGAGSAAFCPASPGAVALDSNINIPEDQLSQIPDATYTMPNPDAYFRMEINNVATNKTVGCLQAKLTNDASKSSNSSTSSSATSSASMSGTGTSSPTPSSSGSANSSGNSDGNDSSASTSYTNWTLFL